MSEDKSICRVCDRPVYVRGYCCRHYERLRKYGDPLAGGTHPGAPRAFVDRLLSEQHTECVIWPFATRGGYACVWWDGKLVIVSRLLCRLVHGEPPANDMEAAHKCGNGGRGCVNPACLYWATHVENSAERILHGTLPIGEKHWSSRLTDSQADDIRLDTRHQKAIADDYGISQSHVSRIKSGKIRSHRSTQ